MKKTNQRLFYPQKVKRQLFCALVACAVCAIISRKTKCSTFAKHFVPKSHLLTQFKM